MLQKSNDNKSLILYTALIFLVAIVMIIISFFAQTHLEKLKVSEKAAENVTLSNKAAQVSEENLQLVELNRTLRIKNKELLDQNSALIIEKDAVIAERDESLKKNEAYAALIEVYDELIEGNKKSAKKLLLNIFTEDLAPEHKEIYDKLAKELE